MKLKSKASIEARKRDVLGRLLDPNYEYHNTTEYEARMKRKMKEENYDPRKRVA